MQTSAIEFMRAMNSSGLASAMLMNIGRRLRRDNPDALIAKDKEILAAAVRLAKKEQSHAEIEKRLKESEALSTRAMKKLSEK